MSQKDLDRWKTDAQALKASAVKEPNMPVAVALLEAEGVARFLELYWEPDKDGSRPGMKVLEKKLQKKIGEEIRSLADAGHWVQLLALFRTTSDPNKRGKLERGGELLCNLGAAIEFILDDDVQEPADDAWAAAQVRAATDETLATFVQALTDYAGIAEQIKDRLGELGDFDAAWITDARTIAKDLSAGGSPQPGAEASPEVDLRNRIMTLLDSRVGRVRKAARHVFLDHPDIVRKVTSSYERTQRLNAKRAAKRAKKEEEAKGAGEHGVQ